MKSLNFSRWADRALSYALVVAIVITYSMTSLAAPSKPVGELIFSSGSGNNAVIVNGEAARSGRTLFSDSTISTPDGATAIVSLGRMGKIQLGPNTTFSLSAEQATIAGSLLSGSVTVLNSLEGLTIRNASGEIVKLMGTSAYYAPAASAVSATTMPAVGRAVSMALRR